MLELNHAQRQHVADKVMDSANIILASLVIGQIIESAVRWLRVAAGFLFYATLVVLTTTLQKGGKTDGAR